MSVIPSFKYFEASASGLEPVMRPADFRVDLLARRPIDPRVANRGYLQLRYQSGQTVYAFHIGLAKRLMTGTTMLRFLVVRAHSLVDEHKPTGLVLEGDPMEGTFGYPDGDIPNFKEKLLREDVGIIDKCYRMLAGMFNALRALGIQNNAGSFPIKRLLGFAGSAIIKSAMGCFLNNPTSAFHELMAEVSKATGPRPTPIGLGDITLDRVYQGKEEIARNFLNGMTSRKASHRAWLIRHGSPQVWTGDPKDDNRDPSQDYHIGDFRFPTDDKTGWVTLAQLTEFKAIDEFIHRYRKSKTWKSVIRWFPAGFTGRDICIPVGEVADTYFVIPGDIARDILLDPDPGEMSDQYDDQAYTPSVTDWDEMAAQE